MLVNPTSMSDYSPMMNTTLNSRRGNWNTRPPRKLQIRLPCRPCSEVPATAMAAAATVAMPVAFAAAATATAAAVLAQLVAHRLRNIIKHTMLGVPNSNPRPPFPFLPYRLKASGGVNAMAVQKNKFPVQHATLAIDLSYVKHASHIGLSPGSSENTNLPTSFPHSRSLS